MSLEDFFTQTTQPRLIDAGEAERTPIPKQIGPYQIEGLLSEGGMSILYLSHHPQEKIPLVIKVLSPRYMKHPEMIEQFLQESRVIGMSNHPNIVKLYGEGEWENGLYIAMEFIRGITLKQFVIARSLSIRNAIEMILQVAYALLHLHSHGIIHRDLKPENILLTDEGVIKVIDFGIALLTEEPKGGLLGGPGAVLGTPTYMSPEQRRNPLSVSFASDIYALGVVAYELLTGKFSLGALELSLLPGDLKPLIAKATAPDTKERYSDIVDLISDLSLYLKTLLSGSDASPQTLKEIWEGFAPLEKSFAPPSVDSQGDLEIAIGRVPEEPLFHCSYERIRLPNGIDLFLLASHPSRSPQALIHLALIRGAIHAYVDGKSEVSLRALGELLNRVLSSDSLQLRLRFAAVCCSARAGRFELLLCGIPVAVHVLADQAHPHILHSADPPLGQAKASTFSVIGDNWGVGDLLILPFDAPTDFEERLLHQLETVATLVPTPLAAHLQAQLQLDAIAVLQRV